MYLVKVKKWNNSICYLKNDLSTGLRSILQIIVQKTLNALILIRRTSQNLYQLLFQKSV